MANQKSPGPQVNQILFYFLFIPHSDNYKLTTFTNENIAIQKVKMSLISCN